MTISLGRSPPCRRRPRKRLNPMGYVTHAHPAGRQPDPHAGQPVARRRSPMPAKPPQARPGVPEARAAVTAHPPRRLGLALAVIATAQLMVVLDLTIVTVALPHIQAALGFSGSNLEWVVNAYAVAFLAGLGWFTAVSVLCAAAPGIGWLIAARAVPGAGGLRRWRAETATSV